LQTLNVENNRLNIIIGKSEALDKNGWETNVKSVFNFYIKAKRVYIEINVYLQWKVRYCHTILFLILEYIYSLRNEIQLFNSIFICHFFFIWFQTFRIIFDWKIMHKKYKQSVYVGLKNETYDKF
jgi:hypothetical protein